MVIFLLETLDLLQIININLINIQVFQLQVYGQKEHIMSGMMHNILIQISGDLTIRQAVDNRMITLCL